MSRPGEPFPPPAPAEEELVSRSRRGSVEAFSELVRLHHRRVRAYLGGWLRHPDVVDDLAQEVFIAAFRDIASFDQQRPLAVWLLGIARNRALAHLRAELRRRRRESPSSDRTLLDWKVAELIETDDVVARDREIEALQACLASLPEGSARLIEAHYRDGRSAVAIAQSLGKKDGAVRMILMRTREALRACLERRLSAET